jgi:hypothetical protein
LKEMVHLHGSTAALITIRNHPSGRDEERSAVPLAVALQLHA